MARYRKVEVKTWSDGRFRELSPIPPCGQGLWLWLLTGTRTTNIPGIVIGTDAVMAAELRWPLEAFHKAFAEAFEKGMAKGDWNAGLVWLPNASRPGEARNKPESPNVIRSWRDTWDEIPECSLKLEVWQQLKAFSEAFGEGFGKAFLEACRKPFAKAMPNQEQEQEQKKNILSASPPTRKRVSRGTAPSDPEWFLDFKLAYPDRAGDQGWRRALKAAHARMAEGHTPDEFIAGAKRYAEFCAATGKVGTEYAKQAATFLGPDKPFLLAWDSPARNDRPAGRFGTA